LGEDGLGHWLAPAVELAAALAGEDSSHEVLVAAFPVASRGPPPTGVGRDQYLDATVDDVLHLFAVPVAGVGQQHRGWFIDVGRLRFALGGVEHRLEMSEVGADGFDLGGEDDLVLGW
jgi:hypothetical protein